MPGAGAAAASDCRESARFSDQFLQELRLRMPLAEVIGRNVPLRRTGGVLKGCCPFHAESTPSFAVYRDHYHCFGCGAHGDVFRYVMHRDSVDFRAAVDAVAAEAGLDGAERRPLAPVQQQTQAARAADDAEAERLRQYALRVYLESRPSIDATPVDFYLAARGIDLHQLGRQPRALRFHPDLPHRPSGRSFPAMVAAITGADGAHVATHRTWLQLVDGMWRKAAIAEPKLTVGRFAGGCIRLWRGASGKSLRQAPTDEEPVIGEGIETCLSIAVACPELRVLAAVSLGNMGSVALPPQIRSVILAADNDSKRGPRLALQRAAERHLAAGRQVRIARAAVGKDFNDTLKAYA